ncbi:MAG: DUF484 family protein [Pontibacterium sp.]
MTHADLERENKELKRTLKVLQNKAERQESIVQNYFDIELSLLACTRLAELLDYLLVSFKEKFEFDAVNLVLLDPQQAARLLLQDYTPPSHAGTLRFVDNMSTLRQLHPNNDAILNGDLDSAARKIAFPSNPFLLSTAVLPLVRHHYLIGSIQLGSTDPGRFSRSADAKHIAHFASVVAICIENCINYENMKRLSIIDMLTKVHNRRSFENELQREVSRAHRSGYPISCLFMDLDYFKLVNDKYGHPTGDKVLRTIGNFLNEQRRKSDLVARYGGEEFAIILPDCNDKQAVQVAERLQSRFNKLIFRTTEGESFRMTTSIGVSACTPADVMADKLTSMATELLDAADRGVYDAKASGRNCVKTQPLNSHGRYTAAESKSA